MSRPAAPSQAPAEVDMQHAFLAPDSRATTEVELADLDTAPPVLPKVLDVSTKASEETAFEDNHESVTVVRRRGRFRLKHQSQYENSLLAGVGYLELANAADFAANVWNQVPVPKFAAALMGVGATCALCMVFVAAQDFRLSLRNVKLLRAERVRLQDSLRKCQPQKDITKYLSSRLAVNTRELGTEIVDRIVMDVLMGFGSMLVGVGTYMAIGGANRRVFLASNLLSGYIGNGMAAMFGLINAVWSVFLLYRFQQQLNAIRSSYPSDDLKRRLHQRVRRFQWHSIINAINGLVAGAASMVTAERWWGYVVLIPCIISLIAVNFFWRKKLGYDRPMFVETPEMNCESRFLVENLQLVISMQHHLAEGQLALPGTVVDGTSLESVLTFIEDQGMLENYSKSLIQNKQTRELLSESSPFPTPAPEIILSVNTILVLSSQSSRHVTILKDHARRFLEHGGHQFFVYRERHLLEVLSFSIWQDQMSHSACTKAEISSRSDSNCPPPS
ncbi:Uncharacterized protein PECH_007094 [Penicillium ucsense]|uniref:Integral membrane protein n=1 Tax=Penicillium ucsense TaxID=2839758 RepID=A0A8J8WIW0_9EURO|nr:Uncharacterized protein PECM_006895 [Penicillium ucsense]KAF7735123.1 Uncharacterized protein PECH_007094 [Penicillium ucsense]